MNCSPVAYAMTIALGMTLLMPLIAHPKAKIGNPAIYNTIAEERKMIYIEGLLAGIGVTWLLGGNTCQRFVTVMGTAVLYYLLFPKSTYMLNHLQDRDEIRQWVSYYRRMQVMYYSLFSVGLLIAFKTA